MACSFAGVRIIIAPQEKQSHGFTRINIDDAQRKLLFF
jgi:hypothetical protein